MFAAPHFSVSSLHWGNKTLVFRSTTQQAFSKARYGPIISTVLVNRLNRTESLTVRGSGRTRELTRRASWVG